MAYLYIDTTDHLIVGLLDKHYNWQGFIEVETKKSSAKIHSLIYQLLKENGLDTQDVNTLFQVSGPGSYTGMRVSEGISQVFEWQKIDVYSFYHFEVPFLLGHQEGIWFANAFKGEMFVYTWNGDRSSKELMSLIDFEAYLKKNEGLNIYTNFVTKENTVFNAKIISTGALLKGCSDNFFNIVKNRGLRVGPYYYRSESDEFKVTKKNG